MVVLITDAADHEATTCESLPLEVLSRIFCLGALEMRRPGVDDDDDDDDDEPEILFEMLVSQVNRTWRETALASHALWSHISLTDRDSCLERIEKYVDRSGEFGLSLNIDLSNAVNHTLALDVLFSQVYRWYQCSIDIVVEAFNNPLVVRLSMLHVTAPRLRHLSITVGTFDTIVPRTVRDLVVPQILRSGSSALSFLRLRALALHYFRPCVDTVTTLYIEQTKPNLFFGYPEIRAFFQQPIQLVNLVIYGDLVESWPVVPSDLPTIDMPHLRSLRYSGAKTVTARAFSGFLLALNCPLLESLFLTDVHPFDLDPFFEHTDSQKMPLLTSLIFSHFELPANRYCSLFRVFPFITDFTVSHTLDRIPQLLQMWSFRNSCNAQQWPKLHTFNFAMNFPEQYLIKKVVQERSLLGCPIQQIGMLMPEGEYIDELEDSEWLQKHTTIIPVTLLDNWPDYFTEEEFGFMP